jgi:hypothetical protein
VNDQVISAAHFLQESRDSKVDERCPLNILQLLRLVSSCCTIESRERLLVRENVNSEAMESNVFIDHLSLAVVFFTLCRAC